MESKDQTDCGCGPTDVTVPTSTDLPNATTISKLNDVPVYDSKDTKQTFRAIYDVPDVDKHLIIFVRHFFCGNCQEYIRHLAHLIPQSSLPPKTKITVIGHGAPELMGSYIAATKCPYDMYTDPDKKLFAALELGSSKAMGEKPKYIKQSLLGTTISGIMQGLSSGKNALKGGDFWQIGGEFLFVRDGGNWKVTWAHRMRTTRDHAEVEDLMGVLGVEKGVEEKDGRDRTWKSGLNEATAWRKGSATEPISEKKDTAPAAEAGKNSQVPATAQEKPYKVLVDSEGREFLPTSSSKHGATNAWLKV